jgi:membrane-associated protease RseP (regulator of RpoE activity)
MTFVSFLSTYRWTILFYAAVILLVYLFRKRFDWQGIIGLYRTQVGLALMDRMGRRKRLFRLLGNLAIVVGFAGMLFITGMLVKGLYDLVFVPGAPPVISPVLPGVAIPGVGIRVPLIIGWLALFAVIVIHEFSHGVVARAHNIPVKSSGLMVFGPLGGAFVEPDEKVMRKRPKSARLSVFAAGPFSNLAASILFLLVLSIVLAPLLSSFVAHDGVVFGEVQAGFPAAAAGVRTGIIYDRVNNASVNTTDQFLAGLKELKPGDTVTLESTTTCENATIVATTSPSDPAKGYLGVVLTNNLKEPGLRWLFSILSWLTELVTWIFLLGLGIGLANLLPLGPVDGGRMLQVATEYLFGAERGRTVWKRVTIVVIAVLVVLLFTPLIRSIF